MRAAIPLLFLAAAALAAGIPPPVHRDARPRLVHRDASPPQNRDSRPDSAGPAALPADGTQGPERLVIEYPLTEVQLPDVGSLTDLYRDPTTPPRPAVFSAGPEVDPDDLRTAHAHPAARAPSPEEHLPSDAGPRAPAKSTAAPEPQSLAADSDEIYDVVVEVMPTTSAKPAGEPLYITHTMTARQHRIGRR